MQIAFSIEESSAITGIGRTKIYEAINAGDLRAKKMGKRTLILKNDLETFLSSLASYPTARRGDIK